LGGAYQWKANGTYMNGETLSILRILNITADSGGEYTCVDNSVNTSASTFLFVYPYFLTHPGDMQLPFGSMILLTCDAKGFPNPEYLWTRADRRSIRSDVIDERVLNITDVRFGDGGEYFCNAAGRGMSFRSRGSNITGMHNNYDSAIKINHLLRQCSITTYYFG
jgi:hypothetical protein